MGVPGWTRYMRENSGLSASASCDKNSEASCVLWSPGLTSAEQLPPNSVFHVDGLSLVFYVLNVASARNRQNLLTTGNNTNNRMSMKKASAATIRRLVPPLLPMHLITEVVHEFCEGLLQAAELTSTTASTTNLHVYWDGDERVVLKQATDSIRQSRFAPQWSQYRDYCEQGRFVLGQNKNNDIGEEYPQSRLLIAQVKHALQYYRMVTAQASTMGVAMHFCEQEADAIVARAVRDERAQGIPAFTVGTDSDYCFFDGAPHIPLDTLAITDDGIVTGVVWDRKKLAADLDLAAPELLVECAMLLGNDYVEMAPVPLDHPNNRWTPDEAVAFVGDQEVGYRVIGNSPEQEEAIQYSRSLYNLQDICHYETYLIDGGDSDDDCEEDINGNHDSPRPPQTDRPALPHDFPLEDVKLRLWEDTSVKDAVIRTLETYLEEQQQQHESHAADDDNPHRLLQKHVEIFRAMPLPCRRHTSQQQREHVNDKSTWRPQWEDVFASYVLERTTSYCFLESPATIPILKQYNPGEIFDPYLFHEMIQEQQQASNMSDEIAKDAEVEEPESAAAAPQVLPVDEHRERILESVYNNRVTIIQGETGCGKSTRIPVMLLNAPSPNPTHINSSTKNHESSQLFICQPRRLAAKALVERIRATEPELRDQIALRMGHGVSEYQTRQTRAWVTTTGYLVRLLANHPERFDHVSYLVIDEVHERSVDSDLLCLLCRRLLQSNSQIRLVLMSATLAAQLYQEYFGVPEPPIKVGARRFPVETVYLDSLVAKLKLSGKERKLVESLRSECNRHKCLSPPSLAFMEKICELAVQVAVRVGKPGSSVLIFCSGMNEIVSISEKIEDLFVPGLRYTCLPIHSDVPFEDQMNVFERTASDEVKIIVATNAAESSVTVPDVDHVICMGLCKQIVYNQLSHRQMLTPTWICQASATQRAGRTGRVRPGTVYRLYTEENHDSDMQHFEPGEMLRIPLDSVILMLKEMLSGEMVTDVLMDCLEPPNLMTVERSFKSLHESNFISEPEDESEITSLGSFVLALGIDLQLGSVVGLGAQFGVVAEAIQLAAVLSFPKSPWIMSNPLIHSPKEYNKMTSKTYVSKCHYDANLMSDPLAAMNLIWDFEKAKNQQDWCWKRGIAYVRVRRLASTASNLRKRVASYLQIPPASLDLEEPPHSMPHAKITLLRVVQAWVFKDSMVEMKPQKKLLKNISGNEMNVALAGKSDKISRDHLEQVLDGDRHAFKLTGYSETKHSGDFSTLDGPFDFVSAQPLLEERFLSVMLQKEIDVLWISTRDRFFAYCLPELTDVFMEQTQNRFTTSSVTLKQSKGRGIRERAAGTWVVDSSNGSSSSTRKSVERVSSGVLKKKQLKQECRYLAGFVRTRQSLSAVSCDFSGTTTNDKQTFHLTLRGPCPPLNNQDLKDLLASHLVSSKEKNESFGQSLVFSSFDSKPMWGTAPNASSWDRPIVKNIPEGARLLSVLMAGRRRDPVIKFLPNKNSAASEKEEEEEESDDSVKLFIKDSSVLMNHRWTRFNSDSSVYVETNSVPASTVHMDDEPLYCCCAGALEVNGGGLRVEGLTLLPPGRRFLLLCRISFGLFNHKNLADGTLIEKSVMWAYPPTGDVSASSEIQKEDFRSKLELAIEFEEESRELGEELVCFERKVPALLAIFSELDGHESTVWANFSENPLIPTNLRKLRQWKLDSMELEKSRNTQLSAAVQNKSKSKTRTKRPVPAPHRSDTNMGRNGSNRQQQLSKKEIPSVGLERIKFKETPLSVSLFTSQVGSNTSLNEDKLYATNILAMVFSSYEQSAQSGTSTVFSLGSDLWRIYRTSINDTRYYHVQFHGKLLQHKRRYERECPAWLNENRKRPGTIKDALNCVPPRAVCLVSALQVSVANKNLLVFSDPEIAMQMEAVFWLERQFCRKNGHWYQRTLSAMVQSLIDRHKSTTG